MSDLREETHRLIDEAWDAWDDGDPVGAERVLRRALESLPEQGEDDLRARVLAHRVDLFAREGAFDRAQAELGLLRAADGQGALAALAEGKLGLELWRFEEARSVLLSFDPPPELAAETAYTRAMAAELCGRQEEAEGFYAEAEALDPGRYPRPVRISDDALNRILDEALQTLPWEIRETLENVVMEIVEAPRLRGGRSPEYSPFVLGLYSGRNVGEKSVEIPFGYPDRIELFKRNLERRCRTPEELRREIRVTLLHEIGHHLGFDEESISELEEDM